MDTINEIKLRLHKFLKNRFDRTSIRPIKIIEEKGGYYLIFESLKKPHSYLSAVSNDGFDFEALEKMPEINNFEKKYPSGAILQDNKPGSKKIMYYGDRHIFLAKKDNGKTWKSDKKSLILSPFPIDVGGVFLFPKGLLVLYYEKFIENGTTYYKAYFAEFDKKNPDRLLWKTEKPVWNSRNHWVGRQVSFFGAIKIKDNIVTYWYIDGNVILAVLLTGFTYDPTSIKRFPIKLAKHKNNPIITPRPHNKWEAFTTLNPAATYAEGKVHILYRAQGFDYISSVGYAVSSDGITIDHRSPDPIYYPTAHFETNKTGGVNPNLMSAGGYGGCEDPRITILGNKLYMVYVAFDGWSNLRLALTSIELNDFLNQRWNWEKPVLISPPGIIDKSGCLLPEKINGKYVFFHRIFPNILIDFVEDLNFDGKKKWLQGQYQIKIRPGKWDSRKIGVGAPPLKTKKGWLLIYYGVDNRDAGKYHIGAMILDSKNPTRVLHRTDEPILSPTEKYETSGFKPGIAYPCGAVILKDEVLVYYGAADSVVCVAKARLSKFLKDIMADRTPRLHSIQVKEVNY